MKKLSVFAALVFFIAFTAMATAQIQSGSWASTAGDPSYNLNTNSGDRSMTIEVSYNKPFEVKPKVILSVTHFDGDKAFNLRYNVEVLSVSRDGFTIKIRTWSDSKIYGISGYWLAYTE
jgi:hypothetical protein